MTLNDRETNDKKAKDWDVLELFYKMDRVEGPKVHASKLLRGRGSMYGEDNIMLMLH